jgi:hypothetical protein
MERVTSFAGGTKVSDEFDALVHLVTKAIVRSRQSSYIPGMSPSTPPGSDPYAGQAPVAAFGYAPQSGPDMIEAFRAMGEAAAGGFGQVNPFEGLCGAPCAHYAVEDNAERCGLHGRVTSSVSGCRDWARHVRETA